MAGLRVIATALLALVAGAGNIAAQVSGEANVALAPSSDGIMSSLRPRTRTSDEAFIAAILADAETRQDDPATEAAPDPAPAPAAAQVATADAPAPAAAPQPAKPKRDTSKGAVTNLPIPRYVSLKGNEGNARRGPSLGHRIDWVFTTAGMPLRVTAEHENWRRVEDAEGMGGWVHYALLSGVRSALVTADLADFHLQPNADTATVFQAERGVVGRLVECLPDWCRLNVQGEKGWVEKTAIWGVDPAEVLQ